MELQELKSRWEAIDKKMDQSINLNRMILEQQLKSNVQTHMDKIFKTNITLLVIYTLCLGVCVLFYHRFHIPELILFAAILVSLNIIWLGFIIFKLSKLREIDVTNRTKLKRAIGFEMLYKYSIKVGYYITVVAIIPMIYMLRSNHINMCIAIVAYIIGACIGFAIDRDSLNDVKHLKTTLEDVDNL